VGTGGTPRYTPPCALAIDADVINVNDVQKTARHERIVSLRRSRADSRTNITSILSAPRADGHSCTNRTACGAARSTPAATRQRAETVVRRTDDAVSFSRRVSFPHDLRALQLVRDRRSTRETIRRIALARERPTLAPTHVRSSSADGRVCALRNRILSRLWMTSDREDIVGCRVRRIILRRCDRDPGRACEAPRSVEGGAPTWPQSERSPMRTCGGTKPLPLGCSPSRGRAAVSSRPSTGSRGPRIHANRDERRLRAY
jgi:hypothetical protein